jgi:hypothetical protein
MHHNLRKKRIIITEKIIQKIVSTYHQFQNNYQNRNSKGLGKLDHLLSLKSIIVKPNCTFTSVILT